MTSGVPKDCKVQQSIDTASLDDQAVYGDIPDDGVCLQFEDGLYAETPDGKRFDYYASDLGGQPFSEADYPENPPVNDLEKNIQNAYESYQGFRTVLKNYKPPQRANDAVKKTEDGSQYQNGFFKGMTPGQWTWKGENGATKERTWTGPDGAKKTEEIYTAEDGTVTTMCDDNICRIQDTRPDYFKESLEDPDGWEKRTFEDGSSWDVKITLATRTGEVGIMARNESGAVVFIDPRGRLNYLESGSAEDNAEAIEQSGGWKTLAIQLGLYKEEG